VHAARLEARRGSGENAFMADDKPGNPAFEAQREAKTLLHTAREAALATRDRVSGAPFVTLVGVACDHSGAPLLLLSTLSSHTKNLAADPRVSLLLAASHRRGDPLNRPRMTLVGAFKSAPETAAKARYLARNPKAKLYAGFADFAMFRLEISSVHFNGGFGKAAPLAPAEIATAIVSAEALLAEEQTLLDDINKKGPDFLSRLVGKSAHWRAIGLDPDGLDLAAGASLARIAFEAPASTPAAWRQALAQRRQYRSRKS
jgi:putative heme iron utilization protein